jgi:hypothetical protein
MASAIAGFVVLFALAFKKSYITIKLFDEENPQETSED